MKKCSIQQLNFQFYSKYYYKNILHNKQYHPLPLYRDFSCPQIRYSHEGAFIMSYTLCCTHFVLVIRRPHLGGSLTLPCPLLLQAFIAPLFPSFYTNPSHDMALWTLRRCQHFFNGLPKIQLAELSVSHRKSFYIVANQKDNVF